MGVLLSPLRRRAFCVAFLHLLYASGGDAVVVACEQAVSLEEVNGSCRERVEATCGVSAAPASEAASTCGCGRATPLFDRARLAKVGPAVPVWLYGRPAARSAVLVAAGGLSASVAKTVTAPLERAKLLAQAGLAGTFLDLMVQVVRAEGWFGLWRGNAANLYRVIPNKGILLMCSDMYQGLLTAALPFALAPAALSSLAGALAGFTSVLTTYPLELVRTRMAFRILKIGGAAGRAAGDTAASPEPYATVGGTLMSILASDGLAGLYSGMGATLFGSLPFEGLKFGLYTWLRNRMPRSRPRPRGAEAEDGVGDGGGGSDSGGGGSGHSLSRAEVAGKVPPLYNLVSAAIAGALAHTLTHPLDTVRRRMQISGATGSELEYGGAVQCARRILAEEGAAAFFSGLSATVLRSVPNLGIQFLLYEMAKQGLGLD